MSMKEKPLCPDGNHQWDLVRKYVGYDSYSVHEIHADDDEGDPVVLYREAENFNVLGEAEQVTVFHDEGNPLPKLHVTFGDVRSDSIDEVLEYTLSCHNCPAEITGIEVEEHSV